MNFLIKYRLEWSLIIFTLVLYTCSGGGSGTRYSDEGGTDYRTPDSDTRFGGDTEYRTTESIAIISDLVDYAKTFMNVPYKSGGTGNGGFDCSGFTQKVFGEYGVALDRTTTGQSKNGYDVNRGSAKRGDLIFFKGRNKFRNIIGHVGIIVSVEEDEIYFIHASVSQGITIDKLSSGYYRDRFIKIVRIIN